MMDFVFPDGNEKEFIAMAKRLGYNSICFVYSLKEHKKTENEIKIYTAIHEDRQTEKARQKADYVIAKAGENARQLIESGKIDIIYGFEESERKDFIHYRNSGLNQVLCKLMKEKGVTYLASIKHILESKDPQLLGRVMQNIRLCKKFKVEIIFGSFATEPMQMKGANDAKSLMKTLGASP